MAIWSMGSQTQILIGYLPVPAPLLCKYWTSTFFTVTCIWKKKKAEESQRAVGGMLRTDMVEWICRGQTPPILPSLSPSCPPSSYPLNLQPTSASRTLLLCHSGQRQKSADPAAFMSSYSAGIACIQSVN